MVWCNITHCGRIVATDTQTKHCNPCCTCTPSFNFFPSISNNSSIKLTSEEKKSSQFFILIVMPIILVHYIQVYMYVDIYVYHIALIFVNSWGGGWYFVEIISWILLNSQKSIDLRPLKCYTIYAIHTIDIHTYMYVLLYGNLRVQVHCDFLEICIQQLPKFLGIA